MGRATRRALSLLFSLGLLLASCAQPGTGDPALPGDGAFAFAGTAWTLASLNGQPLLAGTTITLEFGDGTSGYRNGVFYGNSSCNAYGGEYKVAATQLEFSNVSSTAMGCETAIMAQESAYHQALGTVVTYRVEGKRLELVNHESEQALRFTRAQP